MKYPMIIIVSGLPGSGKSHFAVQLAALMGAEYINSDGIRSMMLETPTYSDKEKWMVYDEMLRLAINAAADGRDIVLDATFYTRALREVFARTLDKAGRVSFIEIVAEEELIRERLKRPRRDSDANFEIYREMKELWEPYDVPRLELRSTNENTDSLLDRAMEYIHQETYEPGRD